MAKVKICGITSFEALDTALQCGADYIGLVFFPKSPRNIDIALAVKLAGQARGRAQIVALVVDPDPALLAAIHRDVKPDIIQLHGNETPGFVTEVRRLVPEVGIWKALPVAVPSDVSAANTYMRAGELADLVLFDAKPPPDARLPGGNGLTFDWTILEGVADRFPFALAGGLSPDNVAAAIELTGAAIVDVSSGVEARPGKKDPALIARFIAAAKPVGQTDGGSRITPASHRRRAPRAAQKRNPLEDEPEMPTDTVTPTNATEPRPNSYRAGPDERGHFGLFGGRFVAETLMPLILDLEKAFEDAKADPSFGEEFAELLAFYGGRPSPLYYAERLTEHLREVSRQTGGAGGAKIYFKRDELNHTGSHKINNCLGQILLARRMGKTRIIAETGAGQHGVAVATVCARFGLPCEVYMGATDVERQKPNVVRMHMLEAKVNPVTSGAGTLKDAMNEALRDWVTNVRDTYYIIGTAAGPHPYPEMVRDFQSVIGLETRDQMIEREGRLPDTLVACIGGGSNAIGLFHPFLDDDEVAIYGVEAGGHGVEVENGHAASMSGGAPGVLHGNRTYLLQDGDGQILEGHSISAGLDYPGVGPEHSWLKDSGRVNYVPVTDKEALEAFQLCARLEGIIPALEPAHALAHVMKLAPTLPEDNLLVMNMCGRGDKDVFAVAKHLGMDI